MAWNQSGNIRGASGVPGASGAPGATGPQGPQGPTGASGASGGTGGTGGPGTTTWAGITDKPGAILNYKGTWNASTNTPTLSDSTGSGGDVYRVSVGGSRSLGSGTISWEVGDYAIYSPVTSSWEKADTTDAVSSVAGRTGAVTLTSADLGASGSASSSTFLRGDNTWATPTALTRSISTITSPTTIGSAANTDYVVFCGASGAPTLPTAVGNSSLYTFKNVSSGDLTLSTTSSQTVDSGSGAYLPKDSSLSVASDNSNWKIINTYGAVTPRAAPSFVNATTSSVIGGTNSFTLSFNFTPTSNARTVVIFVNAHLYFNNGSFALQSATFNSVGMTTIQDRFTTASATFGWLFGITGTFLSGVAYPVSISVNGANQGCSAAAVAAAYTTGTGFGTASTGTSVTVTNSYSTTLVGAAGAFNGSPGLSGGTVRASTNDSANNSFVQLADAANSTSQTFTRSSGTIVGVPILW